MNIYVQGLDLKHYKTDLELYGKVGTTSQTINH